MANQLPTKEQILSVLRDEPMVGSRLRGALGLPKKLKLSFKQLLAEMVEEGTLTRTCHKEYRLGEKDSTEVSPKNAADNRRPGARSRRQQETERATGKTRRGILKMMDENRFIVTDSETGKEYPMAHRKNAPGKDGDVIQYILYPHPKIKHSFLAKVDQSATIGNISFEAVKKEFMKNANLPLRFSKEIQDFAIAQKVPSAKDFKNRADFRKLAILCIDPVGAEDHDDAVSVEILPDGYTLGVHIADVSHYVPEGSAIDEEALSRSFTQYLPWTAVPMLPDELSGNLCSLHEGVDRLAFSCIMKLNKLGEVVHYEFVKSVVNVKMAISYGKAMELLNEQNEDVQNLATVARLLRARREQNGILELSSTEYGCEFNEKGEPEKIVPRENVESNSWIEECMLIANNCCAKELERRKLQGIFRIHEAPDTKDIMELYYLLPDLFKNAPVQIRELGRPRRGDSNLNPTVFNLYKHLVKRAGTNEQLMMRILRSMQKAHYDSNSFGHFALNWKDYSHFTSPIRRYADLWCHRELSRNSKTEKAERVNNIIEVCDLISGNEIKNQKTERLALKVCSTWLLKDKIGETFEGTVSGVEQWGIYVSVKDPMAEGLVRFRDVAGDDYYIFNPDQGLVYGRKSGKTFKRGDRVSVRLLRVNPIRGEADFSIESKLNSKEKGNKREGLNALKSFESLQEDEELKTYKIHARRTTDAQKTVFRKRR